MASTGDSGLSKARPVALLNAREIMPFESNTDISLSHTIAVRPYGDSGTRRYEHHTVITLSREARFGGPFFARESEGPACGV